MPAYDFWEPLSIRIPSRVMRILSGDDRDKTRARWIESWIHAEEIPIGLLREIEPPLVCRSCGHAINPGCEDHFTN